MARYYHSVETLARLPAISWRKVGMTSNHHAPYDLGYIDLMFCAGVNRMFFHGTCYSPKDDPWPGCRPQSELRRILSVLLHLAVSLPSVYAIVARV